MSSEDAGEFEQKQASVNTKRGLVSALNVCASVSCWMQVVIGSSGGPRCRWGQRTRGAVPETSHSSCVSA